MSSITFGSVGDIISVCLLAKKIVDALDNSRGAPAEYRGIIAEIRSLETSLLEVEVFLRKHKDNAELAPLTRQVTKLVGACHESVQSFHAHLKKYDSALGAGSSTKMARSIGTKIRWQLGEKEAIPKFRGQLLAHCNALNMILITANV